MNFLKTIILLPLFLPDLIITYLALIVIIFFKMLELFVPENVLHYIEDSIDVVIRYKMNFRTNFLISYYKVDNNLNKEKKVKKAYTILFTNLVKILMFLIIVLVASTIGLIFR